MSQVQSIDIERPALLYRVGAKAGAQGLWYDAEGNYTGLIHTLPDAVAAPLPMGPHPIFRADGRRWISVTDTKAMLRHWFSADDMRELMARGYEVLEITVMRYRRLMFETYAHEVYCDEDMVLVEAIDPAFVYEDLCLLEKAA